MKKSTCLLTLLLLVVSFVFAQTETVYPEGLKAGDIAPEFTAKDLDGKTINLKQALKKGPVVILFYQGQWCPYCNKQLSHFSDSLQGIIAKGAMRLAITPETAENIKKTCGKDKDSLSDYRRRSNENHAIL